jgi:S-DNA-T family DNA segregation ATPase FtsK/SpoIIIE
MVLSVGMSVLGMYVLIAVLAYFVSYDQDLAALEGAPAPVPLENPTGWIGARLAHILIYRGFGWIGLLFPVGLLYVGLSWLRGRPARKVYFLMGLALLYFFSTLGGVMVQLGLVEDLVWCGVVGAAFADLLALYIGRVGLLLSWLALVSAGAYFMWRRYRASRLAQSQILDVSVSVSEDGERPEAEGAGEPQEGASGEPTFIFTIRRLSEETEGEEGLADEAKLTVLTASTASTEVEAPEKGALESASVVLAEEPVRADLPRESPRALSASALRIEEKPSSRSEAAIASLSTSAEVMTASWQFPPLTLLEAHEARSTPLPTEVELETYKNQIVETLSHYGIAVTRIAASVGPTVTLFEIVPAPGIRISRIRNLEDDIALSLAALGIRIIAPLPGKGTIGIEVPHRHPQMVSLLTLFRSRAYQGGAGALLLALGKTISNEAYVRDLAQMPHLLIAGATGQGKSVALNCMLMSLLYRLSPAQVRFLLIDPKKVEMSLYQHLERHYLVQIPTLSSGIITEVEEALPALQSLVLEMELRYDLLKEAKARNITEYNEAYMSGRLAAREGHRPLPYVVLIIDELADLMMTAGKEVETPICRLAQLARAVGIHLIVATQRPSVNVITGLIKANFPVRMSFRVSSRVDSRTILDANGAEQLIGKGDMLFSMGTEMLRLQSGFVSSAEIERVVGFIAEQVASAPYVLPEPPRSEKEGKEPPEAEGERDPLFYEAALLVVRSQYGSTSLLQRKLGIGFNRAGRLMDQLERAGIVSAARGSKPREVLIQDEGLLEDFR